MGVSAERTGRVATFLKGHPGVCPSVSLGSHLVASKRSGGAGRPPGGQAAGPCPGSVRVVCPTARLGSCQAPEEPLRELSGCFGPGLRSVRRTFDLVLRTVHSASHALVSGDLRGDRDSSLLAGQGGKASGLGFLTAPSVCSSAFPPVGITYQHWGVR